MRNGYNKLIIFYSDLKQLYSLTCLPVSWCKFIAKTMIAVYGGTEVVTQKLMCAVDPPWLEVGAAPD